MKVEELFNGVYRLDGKIATENLDRGKKVYNEELRTVDKTEYRMWNPYRSKLGAAILKGLKTFKIRRDSNVLYIGAATGTTTSHVSDIVRDGRVYCVELSERNMRDLINVCESRRNMMPILADANFPEKYEEYVGQCDILYQDASARDQAELILRNSRFIESGGYIYFVIKSQSIDISEKPEAVFKSELDKLKGEFELIETVDLEPYDSLHLFAVLRKK
jgi:fibrillarin-like pre-rRNA processing protein